MWNVCQTEKCPLPEKVEGLGANVWEKRKNFFGPCAAAARGRERRGDDGARGRWRQAERERRREGRGGIRAALGMGHAAMWWSRVGWVRGAASSRALRGFCAEGLVLARRACPRAVETRGGNMRWKRAVLGGARVRCWSAAGVGARDFSRKTGRRASGAWGSGPSFRP
jgi:hypothetical protein